MPRSGTNGRLPDTPSSHRWSRCKGMTPERVIARPGADERKPMSWIDHYRSKLMSAREAVGCVESGMRVYIHPGCAEPEALVEALMLRAPYVKNVELMHLLTYGTSPYCAPEMAAHFRHNALFVGGNVREAVNDGRADYTPIFLSEVEALFESGEIPIDVAFIQVSPPDPHGYCSFGVAVDLTLTAAKCAHRVL